MESKQPRDILTELAKLPYIPNVYILKGRGKGKKYVSDIDKANNSSILLDESYCAVSEVPGLKTQLYLHQQVAVQAMLDFEQKKQYTTLNGVKTVFTSAILSEPVGSGKTLDILAIILLNKIPKATPDIMEIPGEMIPISSVTHGFIRKKYKSLLTPTIIFVGTSVVKQWEAAISKFTNLKYISIKDVIDMRKVFKMIKSGSINEYDIVLVKNGKITVEVTLPNGIKLEPKNQNRYSYIYNIMANLHTYCWARNVIDDFDTINIPKDAGIINALFTWYISSTKKVIEPPTKAPKKFHKTSDLLYWNDNGCHKIVGNTAFYKNINVRNATDFIQRSVTVPNPKYRIITIKSPDDKLIGALAGIGNDEINKITNMLNGDAIEEAANTLNIVAKSAADIFKKVLSDRYNLYRHACLVSDFIAGMLVSGYRKLTRVDEEEYITDEYNASHIHIMTKPTHWNKRIELLFKSQQDRQNELKKLYGLEIEKIKDSIKVGQCPTCNMDLEDQDGCIITGCCRAVFCADCGIVMNKLSDRTNQLKGKCAACGAGITIRSLIYIHSAEVLHDVMDADICEDVQNMTDVKNVIEQANKEEDKNITKSAAIMRIIDGNAPHNKLVNVKIKNVMHGTCLSREAEVRKVLLFSNYDSALKNLVVDLDTAGIKNWRLKGTAREIAQYATEFTNTKEKCVLVINSTKHCSGLNLQTATDLVFMHTMDTVTESQVIGRGHRIGRESPLNIWYVMYGNEEAVMRETHIIGEEIDGEIVAENVGDESKKVYDSDTEDVADQDDE